MTRNKLIIIFICIIFIIIIAIFKVNNKKLNNEIIPLGNNLKEVNYNEEKEKYEIRGKDGEILFETEDKSTADFYLDHPDFDPIIDQNLNMSEYPTVLNNTVF